MKVLRVIDMIKKLNIVLSIMPVLLVSVLFAQQHIGTPGQIRVRTDSASSLLLAAVAQSGSISRPVQFENARLATDASNNLKVVIVGGYVNSGKLAISP